MSLFISSLNSGSNGNCYYIGNETDAVLIDAGISCRETEKRMKRLGLNMKKVKAVFISHEHTDHIKGLITLSKKYQLPVYITQGTHKQARIRLEKNLIFRFRADEPIQIGDLLITPFSKFHDAGDPHSFTISSDTVTIGVFTDLGRACTQLVRHFKKCHAAFLEANYDEEMLMNGDYPYHLKKRITNGHGHLSNTESLELFRKHRPSFMSHLILSHLSENNNDPVLVKALFSSYSKGTEIVIASRYEETQVYYITDNRTAATKRKTIVSNQQLSLFS
jgi:phosphoribosyl 1,2-cyclic phosphodiesterase